MESNNICLNLYTYSEDTDIVIDSVATLRILKSTLGTGHMHTKKE